MRTIDVVQGSPEWHAARVGVPTASCADMILTPAQLKKSGQWDKYLGRLVAEWYLGRSLEDASSQFMDRGTELEPEAAKWYAFDRGGTIKAVGFCITDDGTFGASPDRLVDDDGGVEIKCPGAIQHACNMVNPAKFKAEHFGQVQGNLFVTGRKWWDLVSYNPVMPAVVVRVEPSPEYQTAFGKALAEFTATLRATCERWQAERDLYRASVAGATADDTGQPF